MSDYTKVGIWLRTLAEHTPDPDGAARELLRATLGRFREKAKLLAGEIARDLPEFTIHDITHLDALWETADLVCGDDYKITPAEAFVLGGAFLVHDLGLGLAAFPGGISALRKENIWLDTVTSRLREKLHRNPTADEQANPGEEVEKFATAESLRFLHASRAEQLALASWADLESKETYHLIDDPDIRAIYGKLIGRIAHSHWWPVSKLRLEFRETLGAPPFAPGDWSVDPLKVAAILRIADITHLDERRAPGFGRAVRAPSGISKSHWIFQQHLQKPRLQDGRLVFTATRPFPYEESAAWWLCFETLQDVERELQRTDALLADERRQRLAARGVAGIEDPKRLTEFIPTDAWLPVNAVVRVSNVVKLVRTLGGEALYGPDQTVPLRELVQNASDGVRARRILDDSPTWGKILVSMGRDAEGEWIEVEDNGVGMSEDVLCGALLDFGNPYWGSLRMVHDFPGLLSTGFTATGTYGIGFFSVFMWGGHVRITTRRFEDARKDTLVLEFPEGVESRATLRPALPSEFSKDGGTRVRVWLSKDPKSRGGILNSHHRSSEYNLKDLCVWLAPALEVDLFVSAEGGVETQAVGASDWKTMNSLEMLMRLMVFSDYSADSQEIIKRLSQNIRPLLDSGGVVGRCSVLPYGLIPEFTNFSEPGAFPGAVVVGGLRSAQMMRIAGLLTGKPLTAARRDAIPLVSKEELKNWATAQASVASSLTRDDAHLTEYADIVAQFGGDTNDLPIAQFRSRFMSKREISSLSDLPNELLLLDDGAFYRLRESVPDLELNSDIFLITFGRGGIIWANYSTWPMPDYEGIFDENTIPWLVLKSIGNAWKLSDDWTSKDFIDALQRSNDLRLVGSANGSAISARAIVLKKPIV